MPESPDFDQIGHVLAAEAGYSHQEHAGRVVAASIALQLRLVWNARGVADEEVLHAALAAQHEEIWRGVETHWVRKEAIEDLALRAAEAETKVAERQVPRCDRCRFWQRDRDTDETGDCRVFSDDPNIAEDMKWPVLAHMPKPLAFVAPFAGADGGGFMTQSDFGCVQWDAKSSIAEPLPSPR